MMIKWPPRTRNSIGGKRGGRVKHTSPRNFVRLAVTAGRHDCGVWLSTAMLDLLRFEVRDWNFDFHLRGFPVR
jgi:hypothetical protein